MNIYPFSSDIVESLDMNELNFTRRALKDASMCIGWTKIFYIPAFTGVCLLVELDGERNTIVFVILMMSVVTMTLYFILGINIIIAASNEIVSLLSISMWMFLFMGTSDVILGLFGGIYFMVKAKETIHYVIASLYFLLAFSILITVGHDLVLIGRLRVMAMRAPMIGMDEY